MKKRLLSILTIATLAGGFTPAVNAQPSNEFGWLDTIAASWTAAALASLPTFRFKAIFQKFPAQKIQTTTWKQFNHPHGVIRPSTFDLAVKKSIGVLGELAAYALLSKGYLKTSALVSALAIPIGIIGQIDQIWQQDEIAKVLQKATRS